MGYSSLAAAGGQDAGMSCIPVIHHFIDINAHRYCPHGFDLAHGSDSAGFVDGIPVTVVSHTHDKEPSGRIFLVPEVPRVVKQQKDPYAIVWAASGMPVSKHLTCSTVQVAIIKHRRSACMPVEGRAVPMMRIPEAAWCIRCGRRCSSGRCVQRSDQIRRKKR